MRSVDSISSKAELKAVFDAALREAFRNDVTMRNTNFYLFHEGEGVPDWSISISRIGTPD